MIILPSLEIVPAKYNGNILLSQIPVNGTGDFTVSRALNTATRINSLGNIELVNADTPRIDYFASGGTVGCPALLVEPSGTNGILNSTDITTNWALGTNLTSASIDVIGLSGNNLTVAVSGSNIGVNTGGLRRANNNFALASGSIYTISFLLKKTGSHTIGGYYATITGAAAGDIGGGFDVSGSFSSGQVINTAGTTNRIRRVERWGTDVYRCSETFTMTASGTLTTFRLGPTTSVTSANNPDLGVELGFAAPQIELGSIATSFIPTTTGSVTRNADLISVSGAVSGSIGQTEGTIYAEVDLSKTLGSTGRNIIWLSDGNSINDSVGITIGGALGSNNLGARIWDGSVNRFVQVATAPQGIFKIAFAYQSNNCALYVNGNSFGTVTTNLTFTLSGMNVVQVGSFLTGTDGINDRIRAAALYTTRLTNTQLALLTSPYTSYSSMASALSYTLG